MEADILNNLSKNLNNISFRVNIYFNIRIKIG